PFPHLGPDGGEAEPAVADDDRGDAVPARQRAVRVPVDLGVVVGVEVDEAGGDDAAVGVEHPLGVLGVEAPDTGHAAVADAEVGPPARHPGAVDDHPAPDDRVEARHRSSLSSPELTARLALTAVKLNRD